MTSTKNAAARSAYNTTGRRDDQIATGHIQDTEVARFIEDLNRLGVPIFVAGPDGDDYKRPSGWQHLPVEANADRLAAWRPGWALCAVLGDDVAVIDVDTKNGADVEAVRRLLAEIDVRIYAETRTPSGGAHFYVAGHPDLPNVYATDDRDGLVGWPGVEILSHGRCAYLPGTLRANYNGRGYSIVVNKLAALADGGDADSAEPLAAWVAENRVRPKDTMPDALPWDGTPPDARQRRYLDAALRDETVALATLPHGGRNNALNVAAVKLGGYVAGAGLDQDEVINALLNACRGNGLVDDDGEKAVMATIRSGLRYGTSHPKAVPPATGAGTGVSGSKGPSAATLLVQLAQSKYQLGISTDGEPFGVPTSGARIVRLLRAGKTGLRAELAREYRQVTGKVAPQQALADALLTLEGEAADSDPVPLALRVADHDSSLYLDLGDATGRAVRIDATGWQIVDDPPVLFRRTALTGPLPEPVAGGDIAEVWDLLNVTEADRPLIVAYLIGALYPGIPHPALALTGEQGTGKTTAARIIGGLIDPSPVPVRKAPRDADSWITAASGSWVVALDNLSGLADWLSDTLCRAVTGDGDVRRRLYTDGELAVFAFRRCLILTGIDLGTLRDDLADRTLLCDLDRIPDDQRRRESELTEQWKKAHPRILGALLDLATGVAGVLPSVRLDSMPRMADYAVIQAAVDELLGTGGLARYADRAASVASEAVAADPFLAALADALTGPMTGTAAELLATVPTPDRLPKGWPANARALTALLKRTAPAMRRAGWQVDDLGRGGGNKSVRWSVAPAQREAAITTPGTPALPAPTRLPAQTEHESTGSSAGDALTPGHHARRHRRHDK